MDGYKVIFRGSIDGDPCENNLYQPFKFNSSGNSGCVFKKSVCTEEGQVIYRNGTTQTDTVCRCDDSKGYAFIHRPHHRCYCVPSKEDCSCFFKKYSPDEFLSQDYECLKTRERNADCDIIDGMLDISAVISTDGDITKEGTTDSFPMPASIVSLLILLSIAVRAYIFNVSSNAKQVHNEVSRNFLLEQKDEVQTEQNGLNKHEATCIIPKDVLVQDDNIAKKSLSLENPTIKELLNDLCNECGCNYFPSTTVLLSALNDLIGTYIKETEHG
ncbi:uncharacterized protein LOC143043718 [Mytilus galloprovincialis]|uniref:uncharacterized protein LOC143043718 n=1 Tax=Mytilus galloprovincialis TaxID=29158 RepID=UPI003F7BF2CD